MAVFHLHLTLSSNELWIIVYFLKASLSGRKGSPSNSREWFDHFVVKAQGQCRKVGLPENCKTVLLLNNCSAYPDAQALVM